MEYRLLEIIPKNKQVIKNLLIFHKEIFQVPNTNLLKEMNEKTSTFSTCSRS